MNQTHEISVALQSLRNTNARMQQVVTSLNNVRQSITAVTGQIDPFWEGGAKEAYAQYLVELTNNVRQMESNITNRKTELSEALSAYETTEQKTQTAVDVLSVENIF
ncbi:WXG100 family protein [Eubacterium limosum]|nr:WXG100 family protein [Eubacterium limosum]